MKVLLMTLALAFSAQAFSKDPYTVKPNRWGDADVTLTGVTGDLFATHELKTSRGPGWKKAAEAYIEDKTEATEIFNNIEDGTISEECKVDWDSIDYIDREVMMYKWKAMKPVRQPNAPTVLYVVEAYGDYVAQLNNGKTVRCPYLINEYVFLNKTEENAPFKFLGKIAR